MAAKDKRSCVSDERVPAEAVASFDAFEDVPVGTVAEFEKG